MLLSGDSDDSELDGRHFEEHEYCIGIGMVRRFPDLVRVVSFLHDANETARRTSSSYVPLEELGIKGVREFVDLLDRERPEAIALYQSLRDSLTKVN